MAGVGKAVWNPTGLNVVVATRVVGGEGDSMVNTGRKGA